MNKLIQFGEIIEGYNIPVLNEREIRASAGILFLATFISLVLIIFKNNFLPIKYVLTVFLADFIIRVFINPKFATQTNTKCRLKEKKYQADKADDSRNRAIGINYHDKNKHGG